MKLKVLEYKPSPYDYHICEDEQGNKHQVDLLVDGSYKFKAADLVGKQIECKYLHPHVEIAMEVKIL